MAKERGNKLIANNKKAYFDYFIEEKYEAGIALAGTEVKSVRQGHCSIKESFISIDKGEIYIYRMNISPYEKGNIFNKDPLRTRKLLLHKYEINKLMGAQQVKGYAIVPLKVISVTVWLRWRSDWQKVRNYTTNVRTLRRRMSSVRMSVSSRSVICKS